MSAAIITAKCLISSRYANSSGATEYTVPAAKRAIIDKFTATNIHSSAVLATVHLVKSGDSPDGTNMIVKAFSIAAGATKDFTELQNQILETGDSIYVLADTASKLVIRGSGREVT